jgi:TPR repeat protein
MKGPVGQKGPSQDAAGPQVRATGAEKLEVARVVRTKEGYADLAVELLKLAARSEVEAQLELALAYEEGDWGLPQDPEKSFFWFKTAAAGGSGHAMAKLAHCYRYGVGCAPSEEEGCLWCEGALATGDEYAAALLLEGCESSEKDGARTFAAMLKAAQSGNGHAQYKVGFMYVTNHGVSHQVAKSTEWFQKAADQNLSVALAALGNAYEKGSGVKADSAKAFYFYERAAIQGHARATSRVCPFYRDGWAASFQSPARSAEWAWRAARIGMEEAVLLPKEARDHCANMWELQCVKAAQWWNRNGLEFDREETFAWLRVGLERGDKWSQYHVGRCYSKGGFVKRDDARAYKFVELSANQGFDKAQLALSYMLHEGIGVAKNEEAALRWALLASKQGCKGWESALGWCLYTFPRTVAAGDGAGQDALIAFLEGAKAGDAQAQGMLGYCYAYGQVVGRDDMKAAAWFMRGARGGNAPAMVGLGVRQKRGLGVAKNEKSAVEWFFKAAERDNPEAMFQLGICRMKGQGVEKDVKVGAGYFRTAHERGYVFATRCMVACAAAGLGVPKDEKKALELHAELEEKGKEDSFESVRAMARDPMRVIDESEVWAMVTPLVQLKYTPPW